MKKIFLILLIIISTLQIKAQGLDDIITDRPDQSESAVTVPKGFIQIELGGVYEKDKTEHMFPLLVPAKTTESISAPSALIRWGILNNIELRLGIETIFQKSDDGYSSTTQPYYEKWVSGIAPMEVGAKFRLFDEKNARPEAAFLASITIPVFDNAFKTQHLGAELRLAMANTLSEKLSVSYNVGAEWDGEDNTNPTGLYTLAFGVGIDKKLSMFAEIYGFVRNGVEPDHRLDGGFTYLVSRNVQIDISGGYGITEIAPDFFIGAGVSFRLPK